MRRRRPVTANRLQRRVVWTDIPDSTCPDRREREETCKHIRAVRLSTIVHTSTAPAPKPAPLADAADPLVDLAFAALSPVAGPVVRTGPPTAYDVLYPEDA